MPAFGQVQMGNNVDTSIGYSSNRQVSLGSGMVRALYNLKTGPIRLAADGYNKNCFPMIGEISNNTTIISFNVYEVANSYGWNGTQRLAANLTISSGNVLIGQFSTNGVSEIIPTNSYIEIVNSGTLSGYGGSGGLGGYYSGGTVAPTAGTQGYTSVVAYAPLTINNTGIIGGGGGGGGATATNGMFDPSPPGGGVANYAGAMGGGGASYGPYYSNFGGYPYPSGNSGGLYVGGTGQWISNLTGIDGAAINGYPGGAGGSVGSNGGDGHDQPGIYYYFPSGGGGGGLGGSGGRGGNAYVYNGFSPGVGGAGSAGGAAGYAIYGITNVTYKSTGTIYGSTV